jgi:hypothetical protein
MMFSRFIFVSSALFAGSATAFSVQSTSSVPKTALYANSNDNDGVLARRQVLASLAATTAVTFGLSAANALDLGDVTKAAGDVAGVANTVKENTGMGGMGPKGGMGMGNDMGKNMMSMGKNMGMDNPVEKAKSAADGINLPNPFSGGSDNDMKTGVSNKAQRMADNASDNARNPLRGNQNPVEKAKSMADSGNMGNKNTLGQNDRNRGGLFGMFGQKNQDSGNMGQKAQSRGNSGTNPFDQSNNNNYMNPMSPNKNPLNTSGLTSKDDNKNLFSKSGLNNQGSGTSTAMNN